eukprot:m.231020 g.231020  ORF g.231020 m.231020 type:complete len:202 (+) comp12151_c0_seq1:1-606(+)
MGSALSSVCPCLKQDAPYYELKDHLSRNLKDQSLDTSGRSAASPPAPKPTSPTKAAAAPAAQAETWTAQEDPIFTLEDEDEEGAAANNPLMGEQHGDAGDMLDPFVDEAEVTQFEVSEVGEEIFEDKDHEHHEHEEPAITSTPLPPAQQRKSASGSTRASTSSVPATAPAPTASAAAASATTDSPAESVSEEVKDALNTDH